MITWVALSGDVVDLNASIRDILRLYDANVI